MSLDALLVAREDALLNDILSIQGRISSLDRLPPSASLAVRLARNRTCTALTRLAPDIHAVLSRQRSVSPPHSPTPGGFQSRFSSPAMPSPARSLSLSPPRPNQMDEILSRQQHPQPQQPAASDIPDPRLEHILYALECEPRGPDEFVDLLFNPGAGSRRTVEDEALKRLCREWSGVPEREWRDAFRPFVHAVPAPYRIRASADRANNIDHIEERIAERSKLLFSLSEVDIGCSLLE
ncbi:uncharacterized protein FIBRA_09389 [Fibroporia radiculosa]|uniref:Uncharacterized protein n=1 Tax=Fibroporia radiculosa TaxID=599839 RepID=J7SCC8_9APHY|nr:uncharacterized protein FIBRA_09389 [Fibroporia radiculosa]CCM07066.1 predicted protein [Fibroporia radiculosa]